MYTIVAHHTTMEFFKVPNKIGEKNKREIERYIADKQLQPVSTETDNWEIVDMEQEGKLGRNKHEH